MKRLIVVYLSYAFWFFAACFLGAVIVMSLSLLNYSLQLGIGAPDFLRPRTSGLSESIGYVLTFGLAVGAFIFMVSLAVLKFRRMAKFATPWVIASFIELALVIASLIDMSFGEYPYVVRRIIEGWPQLLVVLPIVAGFVYHAGLLHDSKPSSKAASARGNKLD